MRYLTMYAIGGWCVGLLLTMLVSAFIQPPVSTHLGMLLGGFGVLGGVEYGFRYGRL